MPAPSPAMHRTIVVVDVAGFTDASRTLTHQFAVHEGMYTVLTEAFSEASIELSDCTVEDRGDGAMILIPPGVSKSGLANRFPGALTAALRRYNTVHAAEAKFQLRVVLHAGEVRQNTHGVVSQAVNLAFRVLEADEAKTALRNSVSMLALIASDLFYHEVIQNDPAADPDAYRQIAVSVKGTNTSAWLRLFGSAPPPVQEWPTGQVPTVWGNVPMRNPTFTGREDLLGTLSQRLASVGTTVILSAALHGMGGIGKTHLAIEYIYRRLHHYDLVWWIQATQASQIRAGLSQLAQQLHLQGGAEANTAVPAVLDALRLGQPYRRWLLVFDAADSPDVVRPFIPATGPGEVLITSRNPNWFGIAQPLEVAVFNRDESVELLRRRGLQVAENEAAQLAEKLGDLPLAVAQAAAWQVETGMPVREYLRLFDEKVAEILDTTAPSDYQVSVGAAWNLSFDELQTRNATAYQILQVCAFFAPEPIARAMFTGLRGVSVSVELDAALRDPIQLSRAIRDINRYGLAKVDQAASTLLLHRLVQLLLRNRMTAQKRVEMRHVAHLLLANHDSSVPTDSKTWPSYREVLPHVSASGLINCDDPSVRQLVMHLTQFLYYWGDYDEAAMLARQALDEWSQNQGEIDQHALEAASQLGLYLWALSRYAEAAQINERTLRLRRQISGENAKETIRAELRVAVDMKARGEFLAARDLNEKIYQKAARWYGDDDPITLQTAHDLAVTLRLCGNYQRALELDEATHQRRAEVLGHDNMNTLNTLSGLLLDLGELGRYEEARAGHEQTAERVRQILGETKLGTLRRCRYLAVARRKHGDLPAALELSTQTLQLCRRGYGEDHAETMACALANSIDLRHAGELIDAHRLGELTYQRYLGKLGEHHPDTWSTAVNLAVTLRLSGDATGARKLDELSLAEFRRTLGPEHPHTIACAIDLASDLAALGEAEAGLALGEHVRRQAEEALGIDHPTTLAASLNLAIDLQSRGLAREAAALRGETLARYRNKLESHPSVAAAVNGVRANCDIDPLPG